MLWPVDTKCELVCGSEMQQDTLIQTPSVRSYRCVCHAYSYKGMELQKPDGIPFGWEWRWSRHGGGLPKFGSCTKSNDTMPPRPHSQVPWRPTNWQGNYSFISGRHHVLRWSHTVHIRIADDEVTSLHVASWAIRKYQKCGWEYQKCGWEYEKNTNRTPRMKGHICTADDEVTSLHVASWAKRNNLNSKGLRDS